MEFLRNKPLASFCLSYFVVSCVLAYVSPLPKLLFAALSLLLAAVFLLFGKRLLQRLPDGGRMRFLLAILFCCAAVGSLVSYHSIEHVAARYEAAADQTDTVTLVITDTVYSSSFSARYEATVRESVRFGNPFKILLDSDDLSLHRRDILTGTVRYQALKDEVNGYEERRTSLSKKIMTAALDMELQYAGHDDRFSLPFFFSELNDRLSNRLFRWMGRENGGLPAALLLGNRSELADSLKRDFRRLGLYHMLALSGAHLSILTTMLGRALLRLKVSKKRRLFLISGAILFFLALTGFSPSLTRAAIMTMIANVAFFVRRSPDYTTSLCVAAAGIVLFNPYAAMDYGLHLSFVAAHSCYIASATGNRLSKKLIIRRRTLDEMMKKRETGVRLKTRERAVLHPARDSHQEGRRKKRYRALARRWNRTVTAVCSSLHYSFLLTLHMLPLTWLYFGEMSLFSVPANLLFVPLLTLLIGLTLLCLVVSPLPFLTAPLAAVTAALSQGISVLGGSFSALRALTLPLRYWFTPAFAIALTVLTAATFSGKRKIIQRISKISVAVFALFLLCVGGYTLADRNQVYAAFVSAGKNEGLAVKSQGQVLLCEISDGSYTFASRLASLLSSLNATEIEAYQLTHYHTRQIAALSRLTDRCMVRTLILPDPVTETDTTVHEALLTMAREKGIRVLHTDRVDGDIVFFNGVSVETYPFCLLSRSAHPVTAAKLTVGETELLALGGSFNEGPPSLLQDAAEADVLLFGGHSPVYKVPLEEDLLTAIAENAKAVFLSEEAKEAFDAMDHMAALPPLPAIEPERVYRLQPLQKVHGW